MLVLFMVTGFSALGQTVTGTVTSAEDNAPLPGVSVLIKGTTVGTTTDVDGNYSIGVGNNDKIISNTVSGAGYPTAVDASYSTAPKVHATK